MTAQFDLGIRCDHFLSMAGGEAVPERNIFLGIRGGKIAEVSRWEDSRRALCKEFIDANNRVVLPSLINAHAHLAMTLFRGLGDDLPFHQWIFERILPLESQLVNSEFVRIGTELAALESIRFGVTTVADMYYYAETIADVLDRAGMRGWVSQTWMSAPLPEDKDLGTDKVKLFERLHERFPGQGRIRAAISPHAPYTVTDESFREAVKTAEKHGAPIHTHLCETRKEAEDSLAEFGKTPVQRLEDLGALGPRTLCAHTIHVNDRDIEILARTGAAVVHNPDSNLKLSAGIAPLPKFFKHGIPVALGTDGSASNNDLSIFGAMDLGTKVQKLAASDNTAMIAAQALKCATWDGARALGILDRVGSLEVGKEADVILVDLDFPHLQPIHDIRSQLVYAVQGLEVDTVLCQGKFLMRDKRVLVLDQEKVMADTERMRLQIAESARNLGGTA